VEQALSADFNLRLSEALSTNRVAFIDSAATGHFVGQGIELTRQRPVQGGVRLANGDINPIETVGDFELRAVDADGNELEPLLLKDASVLKASPFNLVSVGMLCDEGSVFHFEKGNSWFTYRDQRFPIEERDGMFLIHLDKILQAQDLSALREAQVQQGYYHDKYTSGKLHFGCAATFSLWHQRLGHASSKRLKFLYESGAAEGFDVRGGEFKHDRACKCPVCSAINNDRIHIGETRKYAEYITQCGQRVVSDVCGPFPESVEGWRYVVSYTDAYSRFSCCYFLKNKSDVEATLDSLIEFYRREGFIIRELVSDAGGEYGGGNERLSVESDFDATDDEGFVFSRTCKANGIKHTVTPARKPQLHGLAESWNRHVMRMVNSLLYASRISQVLWASAVAHANYLKNRLPHPEALGRYTSCELFFKKRPRISDLRVWGCDAYELLPAGQVPGQANRRRVIYVGHSPDRLGWRVFDPITFKFSISFELLFDEESAKKRICALREFDARRTLARQGRLDEFPLLGDDFNLDDLETAAALDSERRLYPIPLPPPDRIGSGGVKGDQEHARAATAQDGAARGAKLDGDTSHEVSATSRTPPSDFMGRSSSVKGHSMGEMYAGYTIDGEQVPRPSVRLRNTPNVPGGGSSAGVASASQRDRGTGSAGAPEGGSAGVAEVGSAGVAEVGSAGAAAVDAEIDDQLAQQESQKSAQRESKKSAQRESRQSMPKSTIKRLSSTGHSLSRQWPNTAQNRASTRGAQLGRCACCRLGELWRTMRSLSLSASGHTTWTFQSFLRLLKRMGRSMCMRCNRVASSKTHGSLTSRSRKQGTSLCSRNLRRKDS